MGTVRSGEHTKVSKKEGGFTIELEWQPWDCFEMFLIGIARIK